jgi:hypothetical protein
MTGEALPPGTSHHARLSESREATKNEPMDACCIQAKYRWVCGTCPANQTALEECFETDSKGVLSIQFNDTNLAKLSTLDTDTWFCDVTLLPYFKYEIGGVNALTLEDFMSRDRSPLTRIETTRLTKLTKYCDIPMPKKPNYYSSLSNAMKVEDLIMATYNAVKTQCEPGGSQYQQDPESHKKVLEMTFLHPSRGQRQHPETVYVLLMLHLKDYSVQIADKCRHPASSQLYFNEKIAGGIIRPIFVAENHQSTLFFATPLEAEMVSAASLNVARKLMTSSDPKTPAKPAIPIQQQEGVVGLTTHPLDRPGGTLQGGWEKEAISDDETDLYTEARKAMVNEGGIEKKQQAPLSYEDMLVKQAYPRMSSQRELQVTSGSIMSPSGPYR